MSIEPDDPKRGDSGVVCSVVLLPDGTLRLVLDDVHSADSAFPQRWETTAPFTRNSYDRQAFFDVDLSEPQLADIGLSIVARLSALVQRRGGGSGG